MKQLAPILLSLVFIPVQQLWADAPVVEAASASAQNGAWRFDVTLSHPDTGWDHYADGWRVLDMQGEELGLRVLTHPHEHEQPFTRSLSGVMIAEGVTQVQIQARDTQSGWAEETYVVILPD
ncbi:hypothetical protein [Pacificibacter marinus]|uniref:hypothetical protein n=1 Tax=Pacificibacter marinus TaxID=658057 RepID=UPI001C077B17|nr:hypothetical protein [Pacificibacter marinus]MBU2867649.1 hypothetical protein [Pacificibacter marinus]